MKKNFIILLSVYFIVFVIVFFLSLNENDFNFAYALDDLYIHLAIAKNLSENSVFGVTSSGFSSSSSSLLYGFILAFLYWFVPFKFYIPLIFDLIGSILIFYVIYKIGIKEQLNKLLFLVFGILIIFCGPLVSLNFTGMEHQLQIAINMIYIYLCILILENKFDNRKIRLIYLAILSFVSVSVRYEAVFLVLITCLLFLKNKDIHAFLIAGISGFSTVIVFGLISVINGSYFLPNTLLVKGSFPGTSFSEIMQSSILWLNNIIHFRHLWFSTFILIFCLFYTRKQMNFSNKIFSFTLITGLTFILHLNFAGIGWFYRYEAYLIVLSLFLLLWVVDDILKSRNFFKTLDDKAFVIILIFVACFFPLAKKSVRALHDAYFAPRNIYEQQVQMAKFVGKYYDNATIVMNDIGTVSYYNDNVKIIDLIGLGSIDILRKKREGGFDEDFIDAYCREKGASVAILYSDVDEFEIPTNWKLACEWIIEDNVVCRKDKVGFYSVDSTKHSLLSKNLKEFSSSLPNRVGVNFVVR